MTQLLLQSLELHLGIIIIAFKLGEFFQVLQIFFRFTIILEVCLQDSFLELIIICITQGKLLCWSYRRMLGDVINLIIEHHLIAIASTSQIESDIRY